MNTEELIVAITGILAITIIMSFVLYGFLIQYMPDTLATIIVTGLSIFFFFSIMLRLSKPAY